MYDFELNKDMKKSKMSEIVKRQLSINGARRLKELLFQKRDTYYVTIFFVRCLALIQS